MTRTIAAVVVLAVAMVAVSGAVPTTVTHTSTAPGPCVERQVRAEVEPGEYPDTDRWDATVMLTNLGPDVCAIGGASDLSFTGDGGRLPVQQVTADAVLPWNLVVLAPGEQASMSLLIPTKDEPAAGCLRTGGVVDVSLPGNGAPVTVAAWLPPVCGPVRVTSWSFGGAPY